MSPDAPRIVLATRNAGKLREVRALFSEIAELAACGCEVLSLDAFPGVTLPDEGDDYRENAAAKARSAARATGLPALGDDSGIEVEALGGAPGPRSARYGGSGLDGAGRNATLLEALAGVPAEKRAARFYCVAAVARPDAGVETAEGACPGRILTAQSGAGGFGYDPIFAPEGSAVSMAELPEAEKNRISHRGRAFGALAPAIRRALG